MYSFQFSMGSMEHILRQSVAFMSNQFLYANAAFWLQQFKSATAEVFMCVSVPMDLLEILSKNAKFELKLQIDSNVSCEDCWLFSCTFYPLGNADNLEKAL